jgi:RNA polymerase sigma-70 factor (ECF subfamily)
VNLAGSLARSDNSGSLERDVLNEERERRFQMLVWPEMQTVLRTALLLTHNHAEAEDLAQETMVKAFRFMDQFQDGTDLKAWLMTILRRTRIDRLRAGQREKGQLSLDAMEQPPPVEARPEPESERAWDNLTELLSAFSDEQMITALQQLPEDIRWTLMLVDVEGLDHAAAAKVLDVPVGTVKSRAHRGRAMLRGTLLPLAKDLRLVREVEPEEKSDE